jgi:hypothetical protein
MVAVAVTLAQEPPAGDPPQNPRREDGGKDDDRRQHDRDRDRRDDGDTRDRARRQQRTSPGGRRGRQILDDSLEVGVGAGAEGLAQPLLELVVADPALSGGRAKAVCDLVAVCI